MTKLKSFAAWAVGLGLIGGLTGFAQVRAIPIPPRFEFSREFVLPELPPLPPIPEIPEMPPMPRMPAMPPMPLIPGFYYEFGAQASSDPEVRLQQEVFRMLLQNNSDRAVEIATERLKSNPSDPVVLANMAGLAASTSAKSQPLLVSIAKTSDSQSARREAVAGIARGRGDKDAIVTTLVDILATAKDEDTQRAIAGALAGIDTERSLRSLTTMVQDKSRSVEFRRSALSSISRNSASNLALLEELYTGSSDNPELRRSVVSSISRRTDPRTVSVLVRVARSDPDMAIRRSAIQALGNRKDPESIKALEDLLKP